MAARAWHTKVGNNSYMAGRSTCSVSLNFELSTEGHAAVKPRD